MAGNPPPLDSASCRLRQERLCKYLESVDLDGAIFFNRHYVYTLSGYWHEQPLTPTAVLLTRDGKTSVVTHAEIEASGPVDEAIHYTPNHLFTLKPNLSASLVEALKPSLESLKHVGTCEQTPAALFENLACRDITEDYQYLRRKKEADEVRALEHTIECANKVYSLALQTIEPGLEEVELMAAMLEEATYSAGEVLSGWGQDFQCGVPGGFARPNRPIESDELYILDVGVGIRGYRSDLCRTFSVNGTPTEKQLEAHAHVLEVMKTGEKLLRPGQSCREFYEQIHGELEGWSGYHFIHHAGHGIGLDAHEVPRLNPAWEDVLEEGDVVAFEPGIYGEDLKGGIRLENNYLITESGHRQLSHFPLDLTATT